MRVARVLSITALLCLGATCVDADIELREEHTFAARPGQTVVIDVSLHEVEVEVAPGDTVHAVVELRTSGSSAKSQKIIDELAPVFLEKGDTLTIRSTRKGGWGWYSGNIRGHVSVTMPPGLDLLVDSSSGSISITGDLGEASASCDASSGSITVRGALRELELETSSGSIRAEVTRPLESFWADASSGSIRLSGGAHTAEAGTSSGSITLLGLLGDARMDASSGGITGQWDSIPVGASIKADASSGSVTIRLPAGTEVTGWASTSSGGIRTDFPGVYEKNEVTFTGGPDAVEVKIDTSSGGVKVLAD